MILFINIWINCFIKFLGLNVLRNQYLQGQKKTLQDKIKLFVLSDLLIRPQNLKLISNKVNLHWSIPRVTNK